MLNQLKVQNIKNILLRLLACKQATKQVLGQKTGLSNTTVSDSINSLLQLGFVVTKGNEASIGGRRSAIYTICREYGQFIGVQLEPESLKLVVTNALGEVLEAQTFSLLPNELPVQMLYRSIEAACALPQAPNPLAIGIGLHGAMDYKNQIVLESIPLGWQNVHLKEIVERRFFIPTFIDNTINGQIPLEQFINQPNCPENLMVLSEAFPHKFAVCVDGDIRRGAYNLCGAIQGFNQALQMARTTAESWDVSQLVVRYQSPQYKNEAQAFKGSQVQLETGPLGEQDLPRGMALLAETLWFESIYFLLQ